ncbi:hypothetical protein L7F22_063167 [Adiantum nelumboides]|nr:hypothetical protein [Adiantum nelumboides]
MLFHGELSLLSDSKGMGSPIFSDTFFALHKFLPFNTNNDDSWPVDAFLAMDAYSCDDFRMYEFNVRRCMRGRSHDWTQCPFAHLGEKACVATPTASITLGRPAQTFARVVARGVMPVSMPMEFLNVGYTMQESTIM